MRSLLIIGPLVLAAIIAYLFFVPHTKDVGVANTATTAVPVIYVHDAYAKGTHTLKGALLLPTPCTTLSVSADLTGASSTAQIALTIDMPPDVGTCLQRAATTTFSTTVTAPRSAPLTASVNGAAARVISN